MKALPVSIFEDKYIGNCSNNGISKRFNQILLLCPEGYIEVDENNPPENLCKISEITLGYDTYYHVEPVAAPKGAGWMAGGSLVYSCDSRYRRLFPYPLSLHDRQETWKQYEALSH